MKHGKIKAAVALLLLTALLGACSAKGPQPYAIGDVQTLLDAGVFDGEMEAVEGELLPLLYGIDPETVVECAGSMAINSSVSADEVAVLVLADETAAQAALEACQQRLADQLRTCRSYAPGAVPALEAAVAERVDNTVLLAVGNPDTLPQAVEKLHR